MARPTVLVVDGDEPRRRELVRGLAGYGYEVVTAASAHEGTRFATGLRPDVVVAEAGMVDDTNPFGVRAAARTAGEPPPVTVLLVEAKTGVELPAGVLAAEVAGATPGSVLRKVRTVLLGRELGLASDPHLESLVGDLQAVPLFELLPSLHAARVTGSVRAGGGELFLEEGEVIAARADKQRGLKAFSRIARTAAGHFRVVHGESPVERELFKDLLSLMAFAMEDMHQYDEARSGLPSLSSRLRLPGTQDVPATPLSSSQQRAMEDARSTRTLWNVLDKATAPDGAALADVARLVKLGLLQLDAPEVEVRIVTDSTADLPCELVRRNRIHVVPLSVTFGTEVYRDGVDLTPETFYRLLGRRGGAHPLTAPPAQAEFLAAYRMVAERSDVVSVHASERLSHTVVTARAAAKEGRDELCTLRGDGPPALEVVDSLQVSTGLALLVLMAARMAHRGLPAHEIRAHLEAMRGRVHLLFVADTPEYLARGGRLGRAQAWLGGMLGVRPILGLEEGEIIPVGRVRRADAAHPRVIELFKQRVDVTRPVMVGIGHAGAPVLAVRLRSLLQDTFTISEMIENEIGPVVGTHVGPGCVGAAAFQPTEDEQALVSPAVETG
jgi:DegV family protein with EDD domain